MRSVLVSGAEQPGIPSKHIVLSSLLRALDGVAKLHEGSNLHSARRRTPDIIVDFNRLTLGRLDKDAPPTLYCMHGSVPRNDRDLRQLSIAIRPCDRLWVTCSRDALALQQSMPTLARQAVVIPLAVDQDLFQVRETLWREGDQPQLGFIGRLIPQKGILDAIHISASVAAKLHRKITLTVLGDFSTYSRLGLEANDAFRRKVCESASAAEPELEVRFEGFVADRDLLARRISSLTLLLHPTRLLDENFGLAVIEAMASGVPVISTDWGGLADTVPAPYRVPTFVTFSGPRFDPAEFVRRVVDMLGSEAKLQEARQLSIQSVAALGITHLRARLLATFERMELGVEEFLPADPDRSGASLNFKAVPGLVKFAIAGLEPIWRNAFQHARWYGTPIPDRMRRFTVNEAAQMDHDGLVRFRDDGWPAILDLRGGIYPKSFSPKNVLNLFKLGLLLPQ